MDIMMCWDWAASSSLQLSHPMSHVAVSRSTTGKFQTHRMDVQRVMNLFASHHPLCGLPQFRTVCGDSSNLSIFPFVNPLLKGIMQSMGLRLPTICHQLGPTVQFTDLSLKLVKKFPVDVRATHFNRCYVSPCSSVK